MRKHYLVVLAAVFLFALVAVPCWAQDELPAVADQEAVVEPEAVAEPEPAADPEAEAVEPEPVAEPEAEPVVEAEPEPVAEVEPEPVIEPEPEPQPAPVPVVEPEPVQEPAPASPLTSVDTGEALQEVLAAHAAVSTNGEAASTNVDRLEGELLAARERATAASASMGSSAGLVYAAFSTHISTLQAEHEAQLEELRQAQANFAP